jgi:hypothetical protein
MASLGDLLAAENISLLTSFISKSISNCTDAIDGIGHFLHTGTTKVQGYGTDSVQHHHS